MKDDEENFVSRIISRQKNPPSIIVEEYACNIFSRERTPPKVEDEFFEKYGLENFVRLHIYVFGNLVEFWTKFVSTHIYIAISEVVVPFPVKRNSRR